MGGIQYLQNVACIILQKPRLTLRCGNRNPEREQRSVGGGSQL